MNLFSPVVNNTIHFNVTVNAVNREFLLSTVKGDAAAAAPWGCCGTPGMGRPEQGGSHGLPGGRSGRQRRGASCGVGEWCGAGMGSDFPVTQPVVAGGQHAHPRCLGSGGSGDLARAGPPSVACLMSTEEVS